MPLIASAERWIGWAHWWSGMRARASQLCQKRFVLSTRAFASFASTGVASRLRPGQGAEHLVARLQLLPGADPTALDSQCHVGVQPQRLTAPCRVGGVATAVGQRPDRRLSAVVEHRLTHEIDVDGPLGAADGSDQHVRGVVIDGRTCVRCDLVLSVAGLHRQRVADDGPAGEGPPRGDNGVRPRLVDARDGVVDAERPDPERSRLAVEQRPEHARRVEPRDAQPIDRAVHRDECARVTVRQERVVGDRWKGRRHRRALRARVAHPRHRRTLPPRVERDAIRRPSSMCHTVSWRTRCRSVMSGPSPLPQRASVGARSTT